MMKTVFLLFLSIFFAGSIFAVPPIEGTAKDMGSIPGQLHLKCTGHGICIITSAPSYSVPGTVTINFANGTIQNLQNSTVIQDGRGVDQNGEEFTTWYVHSN